MSQVFEARAYDAESLGDCFWARDYPRDDLVWPTPSGTHRTKVAIVGAGYTGMSAALHLALAGIEVSVLDMHAPGWGASGRNGGFCCMGGAKASGRDIARRYGSQAAAQWDQVQRDAVQTVRDLLDAHDIAADTHSHGETQLAHSAKSYARLKRQAAATGATFIDTVDLAAHGMNAQGLWGGVTDPCGFGLHPRKYILGLAEAAQKAGAQVYQNAAVQQIEPLAGGFKLHLPRGSVYADQVILATNGYSRDDVPAWMRSRFMPVQSNILVSRVLSETEQADQGWTTDQMVYDTRHLLHYFRLLPSGHMMFGMRGGIRATAQSDRDMHCMIRRDFEAMFPAWRHVETPWFWTGLVCMTARRVPFVGSFPEMPGVYAGFGWHGNGIAMGTHAGRMLARLILGQDEVPAVMQRIPRRFPFPSHRRAILPPIYAGLALLDRFG